MTVHLIESDEAFEQAIATHKKVFLDFFAVWCGPCKMIAPFVESHSQTDQYKDIYFAKIDVDKLGPLSDKLDIQAMPTFLMFQDGKQVGKVVDPKPEALVEFLNKAY